MSWHGNNKKRSLAERFWEKVDIRELEPGDCWEWMAAKDRLGYGRIGTGVGNGVALTHRVAYELANGPIPKGGPGPHGWLLLHSCDNASCVNPAHLRLGTYSENMDDAIERRRRPLGSTHWNSTLTEDAVIVIRASTSMSGRFFARLFGVTEGVISNIRNHRTWKHVS